MRLFLNWTVVLLLITSCKEEEVVTPVFTDDYGVGMYVVTDNGIGFYDGQQVTQKIYENVNNISLIGAKKIKFRGTKAYILTNNQILTANVQTFAKKEVVDGFVSAVDFDFISDNRILVVDKSDSKVKVANMLTLNIISDIETGENTNPSFIISNSYKSFVLNGGGESLINKDSTLIAIQYRDELVSTAYFMGNLHVGDNPNSAVITADGELKVLCKGIFDSSNPVSNTVSSLYDVNQYNNQVYSFMPLQSIFNAKNLTINSDNTGAYLTAEGGIYSLNIDNGSTNLIVNVNASVICAITESYADSDTSIAYSQMLYMNDLNNFGKIYKYNLNTSIFSDTITFNGNIMDISFY